MNRTLRPLTAALALALATSVAPAARALDLPNLDAYAAAPPALLPAAAGQARASAGSLGSVTSIDEKRGVPTFLFAPPGAGGGQLAGLPPGDAARAHLERLRPLYGLSRAALDAAFVAHVHDVGRGGIVVTLRQRVSGVEVFRDDVKVLLDRNGDLVAVGGNLHAAAAGTLKRPANAFKLGAADVVAVAFADLTGLAAPPALLRPLGEREGGYRAFGLAGTPATAARRLSFVEPARARKVLFPLPDRLVPAYYVELNVAARGAPVSDAYAWVIAADDGRLLYRENLTHADAFGYRVWADPNGDKRPADSPLADFTPQPSGKPDGSYPAFVAPSLVVTGGFNKTADPWLAPGATQSSGNNVDAYTDQDAVDGFSPGDLRATVTSPGVFDRTFDPGLDPTANPNQEMAAVTQLFYVNNWLHDWWYDSGFDEAAGNAQQDNLGRGGLGGDPLHAEAQDGALTGSLNNANMQAGADGVSPRMQMYLWSGKEIASVQLEPQNLSPAVGVAAFGPQTFTLSGAVVLAADGQAPAADACQAIVNDVAGKIGLVERGSCTFKQKALNLQAAGAVGMLLVDNQAAAVPPAMSDAAGAAVTIPSLSLTLQDGGALEAAVGNGPVTATMARAVSPRRDGTIDGSIIAHEWGHYLHHRLVGCASVQCGAESEGWGDFSALYMSIRAADDWTGAYPVGQYANWALTGDPGYFGIRRFPYSVDLGKDPLTFTDISNGVALPGNAPMWPINAPNAEVHNAGEIWATMMVEAYMALLGTSAGPNPKRTYEDARRLMADVVVAGMELAPLDPTYTEQRDALLAAVAAHDPADVGLLAAAFAKRGAGSCAVSPARDSQDLTGVVESFDVKSNPVIGEIGLDDAIWSCDKDGHLDAGETGHVVVSVTNAGSAPMVGATIAVTSAAPGVSFPAGTQAAVGPIGPHANAKVAIEIALAPGIPHMEALPIGVTLTAPDACTPLVSTEAMPLANFDDAPASSATDTFESATNVWTLDGTLAADIWARESPAPPNHVWRGADYPSNSDSRFVSPALVASPTDDLVLSFTQRHAFETGPNGQGGPIVTWDGGVIEVSSDGGATWVDASTLGAVPYEGTIGDQPNQAHNPLNGRKGFVGQNLSWPGTDKVSVNLGKSLAGKTVQVRFRIGSDDATGDFGWELDDVGFAGITNTPFPAVVDDQTACDPKPVPDAGAGGQGGADGGAIGQGGAGGAGTGGAGGHGGANAGGHGGANAGGHGGAGTGGAGQGGAGGAGAGGHGGASAGGHGGAAIGGAGQGGAPQGGAGPGGMGGGMSTTTKPTADAGHVDAAAPDAAPGAPKASSGVLDSGGCGCEAAGARGRGDALLLIAPAAAALLRRRRRRARGR
jgi:hypothetical protein